MQAGARTEWRQFWTLPIAAALGNSTTVVHFYSLGPFMAPLNEEFGWSRAQVSLGLTVANFVSVGFGILIGVMIDRIGPRRVGLAGTVFICAAIAMLGTATGSMANWFLLWALLALGAASIQPTVWTSAVASRFDSSRGLAIAVTISGAGVAASIVPGLTTWLTANYGWRSAYAGLGLLWAIAVLPMLLLFFRGAHDKSVKGADKGTRLAGDLLPGVTVKQGLRMPAFYQLSLAGMVFSFAVIGMIVHFVPVLQDRGLHALTAASIAGLVGLSSIAGRFGTGFLLDRFPGEKVAMISFMLPSVAALLLLSGGGTWTLSAAALVIGLSLGSELDVIVYLATRHFGLRRFGVLFASMMVAVGLGTGLGPVAAGTVFDMTGSYTIFIWAVIPLVLIGAALVGTLGPYPEHERREG